MYLSVNRSVRAALLLLGVLACACGARSGVGVDQIAPSSPVCAVDLDCTTADACSPAECREGECVPLPKKVCNDNDACTKDSCDAQSGVCIFTPLTLDLDGDGHRSPLPGFAPGAPGSCGDDCDDRSAAAHPGGVEVCDGVDNDCNGRIDDGAAYGGPSTPVLVSNGASGHARAGGLAFDGRNYGATYTEFMPDGRPYFTGLSPEGMTVVSPTALAELNSASYAGIFLHNGSYFESAWSDARQASNYEIYFNRFDSSGKKLGPDLRLTNALGFSLAPALAWNGSESLVVWDDFRFEDHDTDVRLFGQRVSFDGQPIGGNVMLTPRGVVAEDPSIALGTTRIGIAFASELATDVRATFFTTAADFSSQSALVDVGHSNVQSPSVVALKGRFLVAWSRYSADGPGAAIYGALVDPTGTILAPEQALTSAANFARDFYLLSLGDRVLMIWADDHDGNYDLYWQMLDSNLKTTTARTRLTTTAADSLAPVAALGPSGDIGVLYDDWQSGSRQVYFLRMACAMAGVSPK